MVSLDAQDLLPSFRDPLRRIALIVTVPAGSAVAAPPVAGRRPGSLDRRRGGVGLVADRRGGRVTVTLSPSSGQTVAVDFATEGGTAQAGSDYTAPSGSLTFPVGITTSLGAPAGVSCVRQQYHTTMVPACFAIALLMAVAPPVWAQDPNPAPLFAPPAAGAVAALQMPAEVLRQRFVGIDLAGLEETRAQAESLAGGTLRLNFFDDAAFEAVITDTRPTSAGYWLTGHLVGQELASVTLVVNGDVVVGTVRAPGGTYAIRWVGNGLYALRQLDPTALRSFESDVQLPPVEPPPEPARVEPIRPPAPAAVRPPTAAAPPAEDGSRIDILVVYTPKAKADHGGVRALWALIDLLVTETNQAYADSAVIQRVHLAHAAEVRYVERGRDDLTILEHLTNPSDGYLDEVHALRDRYAADIVHLMVDETLRGLGWLTPTSTLGTSQEAAYAFNYLGYTSGIFFAHENGHNMGLNHDRYQELYGNRIYSDLRDIVPYPYSAGYVNQRMFRSDAPASSRWWTIMSYPDQCLDWARDRRYNADQYCYWRGVGQVLRFSNPYWTYNSDPTGVRGNAPSSSLTGPSDARASLNNTRHIVANFRRAPCLEDRTGIRLQASNGQYVVAANNGGGSVLANRDRPSAWGRLYVVDVDGGCLESGDSVALRTSDGFYLRADGGGGSTLSATGTSAGRWERFTLRRRVPQGRRSARTVDGAVRSGDFISLQAPSGHYVWAERGGGGAVRGDRRSYASRWGTFKAREVR